MTLSLTKQEKLVLAGVLVCCLGLASFISNFQIIPKTAEAVEKVINYKMGIASEEISVTYTLDGREIVRTLVKSQDEGLIAKTVRKVSEALGIKKDAKTIAAQKKADADKKKQAQSKSQAKKLPQGEFSKPVVKAQSQHAEQANNLNEVTPNNQDYTTNNSYVVSHAKDEVAAATQADEAKKVKKTYEQIKSEFLSNPTRETMMFLVSSYKKAEINAADFYQLQSELLDSNNESLIGHALYALRLTPSNESFSMMVQFQPSAKASYQTYIEEALLSYNQPSQIAVLGTVIRSGDKIVVMKALRVIEAGISSIKNGTLSQLVDSRGRRESSFVGFNLQNYLSLLPYITQAMSSSQDSELLSSLESMKNIITDIKDDHTQVAVN